MNAKERGRLLRAYVRVYMDMFALQTSQWPVSRVFILKTDNGYRKDAFICILTASVKFGLFCSVDASRGPFKFFRSFFLSFEMFGKA